VNDGDVVGGGFEEFVNVLAELLHVDQGRDGLVLNRIHGDFLELLGLVASLQAKIVNLLYIIH